MLARGPGLTKTKKKKNKGQRKRTRGREGTLVNNQQHGGD
jgi:hypothetical protein